MLQNRIDRVRVRNYRSLADVTVDLADLTVLVGENGSGKSNFLDVFHFVRDSLQIGLLNAIPKRHSIAPALLYGAFSLARPNIDLEIEIQLTLNGQNGIYKFILNFNENDFMKVVHEECRLGAHGYKASNGTIVEATFSQAVVSQEKYLMLPLLAGIPELAPIYNFLTQMQFYSIFPDDTRFGLTGGANLREDGSNLDEALYQLDEAARSEINEILGLTVPGVSKDNALVIDLIDGRFPWVKIKHEKGTFILEQESDGTRRTLVLAAALFQSPSPPLIGIEEPELMLHPRALAVLCDNIWEASHRNQVIITTHSTDLIERFQPESFRVVEMVSGETKIDPLRKDQQQMIVERLTNPGDLMRMMGLKRE